MGLQKKLNSLDWKWVPEIPGTGQSYKMIMTKKEMGNYNSLQNDTKLQYGKVKKKNPIGDLSAWHGKCSPVPTWKGEWKARSGTQDPHPWIGSHMGNQACIVPRSL